MRKDIRIEMAVGRWHRHDRPFPSLQQTLAGAARQGREYSAAVGKIYPIERSGRQNVTSHAATTGKICLV